MKCRVGFGVLCVWLAATIMGCTFVPLVQTSLTSTAQAGDPPPATSTPAPGRPLVGLKVGNRAPDFTLRNLQGQDVALHDLQGRVVLMNFWAVWCGFCRVEMPELQMAYETYGHEGLVVLGIDVQEETAQVASFVQEMGVTFPILLDQKAAVTRQYRIQGLPTSILVDADGVIRAVHVGPLTRQEIAGYLAQVEGE